MSKSRCKYLINQCAFYKCSNKKRLWHLLEVEDAKFIRDLESIRKYHSFNIDKKGTDEKREITAPDAVLKRLQARILKLLQSIERPSWLISSEKGKCYIDNGRAHISSSYLLAIDIKKFYDNCKREPVYRFFTESMMTAPDIAGILTDIVTYQNGIPTGCPTSQMMAYYAYQKMFDEIASVASNYGCVFTLYVDDMTFSSGQSFTYQRLANDIDIILRKYGHKPKYKKVRYYSKSDYKPITGTIVTPWLTLKVPNNLQKKIYDNFQNAKLADITALKTKETRKKIATLRGQIQAAKNICPEKFPEISRLVNNMERSIPVNHFSSKG